MSLRSLQPNYKCLDLFYGLGGLSRGFILEGFEVLGVEINREIAKLNPHNCICQDVRSLDGKRFKEFEIIVGSPPCREFSQFRTLGYKWKKKPNIYEGLELVYAFLRIVREANPIFWLMENVPNLQKHIILSPKMITNIAPTMKRAFWGKFPMFLVPMGKKQSIFRGKWDHKLRKWERAKIPLPFSIALARACKEKLDNNA